MAGCSIPARPLAHAANNAFKTQLNKVYGLYTGGFIAFVLVLGRARADGPAKTLDRLHLPVGHHRPVCRHRHHEPNHGRGRVLRRRPTRARRLQRHGHRRRLDVRGVVHRHGRHAVPHRLSAAWPSSWAGRAATAWWRCCWRPTCASSASSRFPTSWARATTATCRASSASSPPSCAPSPTWWRRSTASASSPRG